MGRSARVAVWAGVAMALAVGAPSYAQSVSVQLDIDDQAAAQLGLDTAEAEAGLTDLMGEHLRLGTLGDFMNSMAHAAAISNKGMGADYANSFKRVIGGVSVGSGTHGIGVGFTKGGDALPQGGFAAQVTGMVGINLGGMALAKDGAFLHRISLYANGMAMPLPSGGPFGGFMYNAGGHLQVKLVMPVNAKAAEWGGIALTSGFERSSYALTMKRELPLETHVEGVDVKWTANGDYRLSATNDTIPVELSTSARVLVLTVYVGTAVDFNTGGSDASGSMSGPIRGSVADQDEALGTAAVSLSASGLADAVVPRGFVGAQINVMMVKVYGHLNVGANQAVGGHLGARLAF